MHKLIVLMFILVSSSLFAIDSGFSVFGVYDLTDKAAVSISGVNLKCNSTTGPGIGVGYSFLPNELGFSLDSTYFFERTIDFGTIFGITPFSSKYSQVVTRFNVLLKLNENSTVFGGVNYPYMTYSDTSAKVDGEMGYQCGLIIGSGNLTFNVHYQFIKGVPKGSLMNTSDKYTSEGLLGSVIMTL